jgi:23S rRNA (uracil1939-C5)-methyltransferase
MNDIVTLKLTAFAYGGDSLGKLNDGRVAFVPFALPGETVRVRLVEEKPSFAHAELVEVLDSSIERVSPRCVHFGTCGGCHYQHLDYPAQLTAKTVTLVEQLRRIGGLDDPPVLPPVASPDPYFYRNYVQFHLTSEGKLGYHQFVSREVVSIQECHLPETALNQIWPMLHFEPLPKLERIGLRLGCQEDVQLILQNTNPIPPKLIVEGLPISVVHQSPAGSLVLAGSPTLTIEVLARPFRVSSGSFFQVNTHMASLMVQHLLAGIPKYQPLTPNTVLIDAYCGVGLFSAFLADKVGQLAGIESSPCAVEDFIANLDEFDNVSIYEAPIEQVLARLDLEPGVVLVDPPREGINRRAMDLLLQIKAPLLVYISCDPATLARDAHRLTDGGYRLAQITPFDLFPQTYHLETISFWVR